MKDAKLLLLYDRVRTFSELVLKSIKPTEAGDEYAYRGPMAHVEFLRDAIDALNDYMIQNDINYPDDDVTGAA